MTLALRPPTVTKACRWHRWGPAIVRPRPGVWMDGRTGEMHRGTVTVQNRPCRRCAVVLVTELWGGRERSWKVTRR